MSNLSPEQLYDRARAAQANLRETYAQPAKQQTVRDITRSVGVPDPICPKLSMHTVKDDYSGFRRYEFSSRDGRMHWLNAFTAPGKEAHVWRTLAESDKQFRQRARALMADRALIRAGKMPVQGGLVDD